MNNFKRIISVILAAVIVSCMSASCGNKGVSELPETVSLPVPETVSQPEADPEQSSSSEQAAVSKYSIPDKYKMAAPIGMVGTTKPEFVAEIDTFICDKYKLQLDDTWTCERAYEDYTGIYGYTSEAYSSSFIINILDGEDIPRGDTPYLEYFKEKLAAEMAEYTLREEVVSTISGYESYCYWYEHPATLINVMYVFVKTENYTYQLAGSFYENQSGFACVQNALSTFEPIDLPDVDESSQAASQADVSKAQ